MTVKPNGHDSRAVANKILMAAKAQNINLTIMQLVKLVYFAQGWCLAFFDTPLTKDDAEAWQYGPVYPMVYKAYPKSGSDPIRGLIANSATGKPFSSSFSEEEESLIDWVVGEYGKIHAFQLSKLTHEAGTPWKLTVDNEGYYADIPTRLMKQYFKQFVEEEEADGAA